MKLTYLLIETLNEASIAQLKDQFVKTGKISPEDFEEIEKATGGKGAYATWLIKRIDDEILKAEDIYKWKDYFQIFKRRKNDFKFNEINHYKTQDDIRQFVQKASDLQNQEKEDPTKKKGISKTDKFSDLKIGEVDGFEVYEIPNGRKDLYNTSCELGSGTEWCTATGNTSNYFNQYIDEGPLYIFMKPGSDEKYQFHFESGQFMDKNDQSVI